MPGVGVDINVDRVSGPHLADLGFLVVGGDPDLVGHQRHQRLPDPYIVAGGDGAVGDVPGLRCANFRNYAADAPNLGAGPAAEYRVWRVCHRAREFGNIKSIGALITLKLLTITLGWRAFKWIFGSRRPPLRSKRESTMTLVAIELLTEELTDGSWHVHSPNVPGFHVVEKQERDAVITLALPVLQATLRDRVREGEVGGEVRILLGPVHYVEKFTPRLLRDEIVSGTRYRSQDQIIVEIT